MRFWVGIGLVFIASGALEAQPNGTPEQRLAAAGYTMPQAPQPAATYVTSVETDRLLFLSGHGECGPDRTRGIVGQDLTVEQAKAAAQRTGLCMLATIKTAVGDLSRVKRFVRIMGMVNAEPGFTQQPAVINGFSDLMVIAFGEAGKAARAAVGMGSLPGNIAVEIEAIVELHDQLPWPELRGDYLGQKPPGQTPVKFMPGLISTEDFELNSVFSPSGRFFLFSRRVNGQFKVFQSIRTGDTWSEPQMASFSRTYPGHADVDMMFGPDGKRLYFISQRPLKGYPLDRYNIWHTDVTPLGWTTPEPLGPHINGQPHELYPMIVGNGSLYFSTDRGDSLGAFDTYRAQGRDGGFDTPRPLSRAINSEFSEGDIFVAADESYLIHVSTGRPDSLGSGDLYISFKDEDGQWLPDQHMGDLINSDVIDFCPMVTPDGRYFFFSRGGDIYWVDATILEQFRP